MTVCNNLTNNDKYGLLSLQISPYFYIGVFRLLSFIVLFACFYYFKKNAQRTGNIGKARYFLILPIYSDYLRFLILYSAIIGILNLILRNLFLNPFALSAQLGGFHFFYEGLWFFLTQYGAGRKAFLWSSLFGLLSGVISFFCFFIATQYLEHDNDDYAFIVLFCYNFAYSVLSMAPLLLPITWLYRRQAMFAYSSVATAYYLIWIASVLMVYFETDLGYCLGAVNYILFDGVLKPMVIFYTLSLDSQYWQGIGSEGNNPLVGAWDLDLNVATTMSKVDSRQGSGVPFIHFGLIELAKDMGFVAGGFSRVYFGHYKSKAIALKMLFVVDLTPQSVQEFCSEAKLLMKLKNENVIECVGVCVMPPAVSIVLEFCKYGSLFDVLYKERNSKKYFFRHSLNVLLGSIEPDERVLSSGSFSEIISHYTNRKSFLSDGRKSEGSRGSLTEMSPRSSSHSLDIEKSTTAMRESLIDAKTVDSNNQRKSIFGRESIFGSRDAKEDVKRMLFSLSQSRLGPEWEKLRRWFEANPGHVCSTIIEEEQSFHSERVTDSIFRWSNSQTKSPSINQTHLRLDEHSLTRKDLPQTVMDGLPLGHSLSVVGKLEMMSDVVRGLSFLHSKGYMHCDIKSLNFLVTENFTVKIADLGEARKICPGPNEMKSNEPPVPAFSWCPPEVLDLNATASSYTTASDIFGLAMVLSEIIINELPLEQILRKTKVSYDQLLKMISIDNKRPRLPGSLPEALLNVIKLAWDTDPNVRPSADAILSVLEQCTSVVERLV